MIVKHSTLHLSSPQRLLHRTRRGIRILTSALPNGRQHFFPCSQIDCKMEFSHSFWMGAAALKVLEKQQLMGRLGLTAYLYYSSCFFMCLESLTLCRSVSPSIIARILWASCWLFKRQFFHKIQVSCPHSPSSFGLFGFIWLHNWSLFIWFINQRRRWDCLSSGQLNPHHRKKVVYHALLVFLPDFQWVTLIGFNNKLIMHACYMRVRLKRDRDLSCDHHQLGRLHFIGLRYIYTHTLTRITR